MSRYTNCNNMSTPQKINLSKYQLEHINALIVQHSLYKLEQCINASLDQRLDTYRLEQYIDVLID